ncbi:bifunctional 2-polyprenyl-6-hydroxyphenol methylase/3-demethylubiquinol 3-O-methyltransferase UbiG [Rhodoblastus acidophilus]|uniref:Ubiquinone biosynthesis O-methyltransferase n=1 Tax=Candidatus Rhodoblastus alkanivorans TaxID=2954117 RepID=A0ABS9Z139_9HYPH|nr:bifunctional 2-polyprenyl-6-hydroxyphenol methylase/3-demethylubiquinol 3-O-methyltransferase UbiG [Candidatus Rhodoblastus alkanivorans]MCI4678533.1 bifunctional 2-polyprenyl-6-hydroxyphenol methylase/3-demethylubiquinol 3-O-methyltransferase UbiG [Candidatus Rhodoblastus alkanivorans]MCI4681379.1 bifunctional 2-polyprenyl-6-hydroxyphenol methylase/3-demethylubiquinol 3-O-methyltransferase UbiG [Candidatus Rhodoblastus alkanivorans]MDI4642427.1 bifunctional 2-polyprenyl-6-hydroxyphenol methy
MTEFHGEAAGSVDRDELARFAKLGDAWWDPKGPQRALHKLNPTRVRYLRNLCCGHFADGSHPRHRGADKPLKGLRIVDLGCGGGLLSESLAALGATVTGVDPSEENIAAARRHAAFKGFEIDYRPATVEALASAGETYDIALAMEVLEHVADVKGFLASAAALVRPGGLFVGATLNRTLKSYALAIVGAEYVLRWVEPGTHDWRKFLRPYEMSKPLQDAGLREIDRAGIVYHPIDDEWRLSGDTDVNYMIAMERPPG